MDRLTVETILLTSKEVLEKTGISRATLNNYISWGIVPRPDVLPPEPQDGAAPRIGYFPDEIVQRIEDIQRLKRDGWSITRITEHFVGARTVAPAPTIDARSVALARTPAMQERASIAGIEPRPAAMPGLSIADVGHPAYMVNDSFEVLWLNDAAVSGAWPHPRLPAEAVSRGIFRYLVQGEVMDDDPREAVLRFHLEVAKQRGVSLSELCRDLAPDAMTTIELLYKEAGRIESGLVSQTWISTSGVGATQPVSLYAVHFREGTLFLYVPGSGAAADEVSKPRAHPRGVIGEVARTRRPALTEVAVLVTDLQNSAVLWSELPAEEYFELINQIWLTVEPIFKRHRGTHGKHPGEGMVCYFFPQPDSNYLWNAVLAAHQMREAIGRVSKEWQLRKGWTTELYMNTGIDEGLEWLGAFRSGSEVEFIVLGDTVNHAARLSELARSGAIWVTRNLVGKLPSTQRQQLKYGVRRTKHDGQEVFVPSFFSRVENLADRAGADSEALRAIARLPIAEIMDIAPDPGIADRGTGRNPT
jgi:adenylate cyclase